MSTPDEGYVDPSRKFYTIIVPARHNHTKFQLSTTSRFGASDKNKSNIRPIFTHSMFKLVLKYLRSADENVKIIGISVPFINDHFPTESETKGPSHFYQNIDNTRLSNWVRNILKTLHNSPLMQMAHVYRFPKGVLSSLGQVYATYFP